MSGIAGVFHLDGRPVDLELIHEMSASLEYRGPDRRQVWSRNSIAFCHTLLATTFEAEGEDQPASLDGQVWITADARIDGREDLIRDLGMPQQPTLSRPDCELILHAYARWGEACVEHLLGDFAFAIWDGRSRKLFCARDHMGVKPFYYAQIGNIFVFSNTLNCVRVHPAVSEELNELAIADFLLLDFNQEPATTTFKDILRLPASHALVVRAERTSTVRRYWSLPEGERIRYKRTRDYVECFRVHLETAIADRLRTNRIAVMMSGGLDSSSVAAFARRISPRAELSAHTAVYDWLIPDDERHFSGIVAESLGIPIRYYPLDDLRIFEGGPDNSPPEPVHEPLPEGGLKIRTGMTGRNRVILTGDGSDPLFCLSPFTSWASVFAVPPVHSFVTLVRYSCEMRRIPRLRLRSTVLRLLRRKSNVVPSLPRWLDPDFVRRCGLLDRMARCLNPSTSTALRPFARGIFNSLFWPWLFETDDAAWSGPCAESRHPYFDIRLIRYLLAIPEIPSAVDKYLLRSALKGVLPESVRTRPKSPRCADPVWEVFKKRKFSNQIEPHNDLFNFVSAKAIPVFESEVTQEQLWADLKPFSLNMWLKSHRKETCKQKSRILTSAQEFHIMLRN